MVRRWLKKLKEHFHEIVRTKTSSHSIAMGFSVGTVIGILPTPGISFLIGFLVILLFKKINKYSLFGALLFWNPLIQAPLYLTSYSLGNSLLGAATVEVGVYKILNYSLRYLLGSFILAIIISVLSYFLVRKVVSIIRKG